MVKLNFTDYVLPRPRSPTNATRYRFRHAIVRTHIMQLDSPATVDTRRYTGAVSPSYTAQFESTTNTAPNYGRRGIDDRP